MRHTWVANQAGSIKCLQCGCVHSGAPPESSSPQRPSAAAKVAAVAVKQPAQEAAAANGMVIECPACGSKGHLPEPFAGGAIKCHQCGCVHRV
jgi:transcription initiation factor TFIIIB Brf1 subunit/transcription initiation factor TFIIB